VNKRRAVGKPPRQKPYPRTYPDGRKVWIARYYDLDRRARYAKPRWNGGKSSFARKADAQRAIDEALDRLHGAAERPKTIGDYGEYWLREHPRSKRTNKTNIKRLGYILDTEIGGRQLRDWEFDELGRHEALKLVDHMLRAEGRAIKGARGLLSVLSAMAEDAIGDKAAATNAFLGIKLRSNDPRIQKPPRKLRIWTFDQMRDFAVGGRPEVRVLTKRPPDKRIHGRYKSKPRFYSAHDYEAMILTPGFTGLRLGEVLALEEDGFDGASFRLEFSAHEGDLTGSSDEKNHDRSVPSPPSLTEKIEARRGRVKSRFLFSTPTGKLFRERNFYRDVWVPAQLATGMDPTPHEFRHSYVSNLRAMGVDDADLAKIAGHTVETMISTYTHALDRSHEEIRRRIG